MYEQHIFLVHLEGHSIEVLIVACQWRIKEDDLFRGHVWVHNGNLVVCLGFWLKKVLNLFKVEGVDPVGCSVPEGGVVKTVVPHDVRASLISPKGSFRVRGENGDQDQTPCDYGEAQHTAGTEELWQCKSFM